MSSPEDLPGGSALRLRYVATDSVLSFQGPGARAVLRYLNAPCYRGARGRWDSRPKWLPAIAEVVERRGGTCEPFAPICDDEQALVVLIEPVSDRTVHLHGHAAATTLFDLDTLRQRMRPGLWAIPTDELEQVSSHLTGRGVIVRPMPEGESA